jgi:multidrug resistance efflux pump
MRKLIVIFFTSIYLFSQEHYAKLEPIESVLIKSEVNGRVVLAKKNYEGKIANGVVVKIDDKLNRIDLKNTQDSLRLLESMVELNRKLLPMLKSNMQKKANLYKRLLPLASSSQNQKDTLYGALVSAKVQYFGTKEKIENLKNQIVSLKQKVASLKDIIAKKSIRVDNKYLYKIYVKKGEFVNIGAPLVRVDDISKAKLVVYLSSDELKDIDKKTIYLNGKKSNLKFSKIWRVADEKFVSSYRAEIVLKPKDRFSTLVKVEIR